MKKIDTFTANIYVGLQYGYSGFVSDFNDAHKWLQDYCNKVKLGLTLTKTEFIYVDGREPGIIIGLINYPRFIKPIEEIKENAMNIGKGLMKLLGQERVSIVFSDETIMLEKEDDN
jgi:hypothetical protein